MKPKLHLMSMAELDKLTRDPTADKNLRERALDELHRREKPGIQANRVSMNFSRFNYATV